MSDPTEYLKWCKTERESDVTKIACQEGGSATLAGKQLGIDPASARKSWRKVKARAAVHGYAPDHGLTHVVPPPLHLQGYSTLYDMQTGEGKIQWIKANLDAEAFKILAEVIVDELTQSLPKIPITKPPKRTLKEILSLYVVTDYHFGMMAAQEETRDSNWDIKIAEEMLMNWFSLAMSRVDDSEIGIFCQLGDFLHFDSLEAVTPAHKNVLDADSRYYKVVRVAIRCTRRAIAMLLAKHKFVHVIFAEGNHDPAASTVLREALYAMYDNEPRVFIDISPDPYYVFEFGKTSLFFHHGHKKKPLGIDKVFASKFREIFGRTVHSYAHMGHMHHEFKKETELMVVDQHRTLAASDAYASRGGWSSGRDAKVITYHSEFGRRGDEVISAAEVAHIIDTKNDNKRKK